MLYAVDYEALSMNIDPLSFSRYLEKIGWIKFSTKRQNVNIFQAEKNGRFYQINIPLDRGFSDYKQALTSAVHTLSEFEEKSFERVFLFLLNPNADILKIRINDPSVEPGNMLIDDAINVYENAKKLLGAAVQDVYNLKKYHQGRPEGTVAQFVNSCRFGQTEVGSYIVSVVCPFMGTDSVQLSMFDSEEDKASSLTRTVTTRVMKNLTTVNSLIRQGDYETLTNIDATGISANFFEAMLGLYGNKPDTEMEITAEWSPTVRMTEDVPSRFIYNRDYKGPIEYAIKTLKKPAPQTTEIIGKVKALGAEPDLERRKEGKITVVYVSDSDRVKTITLCLNLEDYATAIEAHKAGHYIRALGNINEKNAKEMICESFAMIE